MATSKCALHYYHKSVPAEAFVALLCGSLLYNDASVAFSSKCNIACIPAYATHVHANECPCNAYAWRHIASTYQAFSVAQQSPAIQDIPVASRVAGELRIARPHRDVQTIQGIIQRLEGCNLQASTGADTKILIADTVCFLAGCIPCAQLLAVCHLPHGTGELSWCQLY